jgi:hypothetical protein
MNMKHQISITSLLLASVLATGCSQQQVQEAPAEPVAAVAAVAAVAPVVAPTNPDCHTHPRNSMTNSITHCHKNPTGQHRYGAGAAKPAVDVSALQRKLKAKGYYKGAIDGVINTGTRDALKQYQNR